MQAADDGSDRVGTPATEQQPTGDRAGVPDVAQAMAVYSADGQADDETGGDAGAEALRSQLSGEQDRDNDVPMPHGPS